MKREMWYRTVLIITVCAMLLLLPVMTQAQDDGASHENAVEESVDADTATTDDEPQGAGLLVLIVGLVGVSVVGGVMISRDTFGGDGDWIAA